MEAGGETILVWLVWLMWFVLVSMCVWDVWDVWDALKEEDTNVDMRCIKSLGVGLVDGGVPSKFQNFKIQKLVNQEDNDNK